MAVITGDCPHSQTVLIAVQVRGSEKPQYKPICIDCGMRMASVKHSDLSAEEMAEAQRNARDLEECSEPLLSRTQKNSGSAAAQVYYLRLRDDPRYQEYLQSPEWGELRALVLYRDGSMCRGCGKRRASDVHHLSYAHLYHEFLFELVSVCRSCHERWHGNGERP